MKSLKAIGKTIVVLADRLTLVGWKDSTASEVTNLRPRMRKLAAETKFAATKDLLLSVAESLDAVFRESALTPAYLNERIRVFPLSEMPNFEARRLERRAQAIDRLKKLGNALSSVSGQPRKEPRKGSMEAAIVPLLKKGLSTDQICERLGNKCNPGNVTNAKSRWITKPGNPNKA